MKRKLSILLLFVLAAVLLLSGCKKKNADTNTGTVKDEPKTAKEIIAAAEEGSIVSSDATDPFLYEDIDVPFNSYSLFVQPFYEEDFDVYPMDNKYFSPSVSDYFLGSFEKGKTVLYTFDATGDVTSILGRVVYDSKDKLLKDNKKLELNENEYNEAGYTYCDNVLYYKMGEEYLFAAGLSTNKYDLLKVAAAGKWNKKDYKYFFSKPYYDDNVEQYEYEEEQAENYVPGKMDDEAVYELFVSVISKSQGSREEFSKYFTEDVPKETIDAYYSASYRQPIEFENYKLLTVAEVDDLKYAELVYYTIPENYPEEKVDNFMIGAIIKFDEDSYTWKIADTTENWNTIGDEYCWNTLTGDAYNSYSGGYLYRRFWVPFNLYDENALFYFDNVLTAKITEFFTNPYSGYVTLYFYNDTDEDVVIETIDSFSIDCEYGNLFDLGCDFYLTVPAHSYTFQIMDIPYEYFNFTDFTKVSVNNFTFTVR